MASSLVALPPGQGVKGVPLGGFVRCVHVRMACLSFGNRREPAQRAEQRHALRSSNGARQLSPTRDCS